MLDQMFSRNKNSIKEMVLVRFPTIDRLEKIPGNNVRKYVLNKLIDRLVKLLTSLKLASSHGTSSYEQRTVQYG